MELKEFIKTAVTDITNAVSELQTELQNGTVVNPTIYFKQPDDSIKHGYIAVSKTRLVKIMNVEFDLAITTAANSKKGGEGGFSINVAAAKIGRLSATSSQTISRIAFQIPLHIPCQDPPEIL